MSQVSSLSVANGTGLAVRTGFNALIGAEVSRHSGPSEPTDTVPFMEWMDTSTTPATLKMRNAADDGWLTMGTAEDQFGLPLGTELIQRVGITSAAEVIFGSASFSSTTFESYLFTFQNVRPASGNNTFNVQLSTNGGSTFINSALSYVYTRMTVVGSTVSGASTGGTSIMIGDTVDDVASGVSGFMFLSSPGVPLHWTTMRGSFTVHTSSNFRLTEVAGVRAQNEVHNGIRFFCGSGNIQSGTITMYGMRAS